MSDTFIPNAERGWMPWSPEQLTDLRQLRRGGLTDLDTLALVTSRLRTDVNRAIDALLGRTPEEAARVLAADTMESRRVQPTVTTARPAGGFFGRFGLRQAAR